jgi:hypothetical protein
MIGILLRVVSGLFDIALRSMHSPTRQQLSDETSPFSLVINARDFDPGCNGSGRYGHVSIGLFHIFIWVHDLPSWFDWQCHWYGEMVGIGADVRVSLRTFGLNLRDHSSSPVRADASTCWGCPRSSYAPAAGLSACQPCPDGQLCFVGNPTPYDAAAVRRWAKTQLHPNFQNGLSAYLNYTTQRLAFYTPWLSAAAGAVMLLCLSIAVLSVRGCCRCCSCCTCFPHPSLKQFDFLYSSAHLPNEGDFFRRRKTGLGAVFTCCTVLVGIVLATLVVLTNVLTPTHTTSLMPFTLNDVPPAFGTYAFNVTLFGNDMEAACASTGGLGLLFLPDGGSFINSANAVVTSFYNATEGTCTWAITCSSCAYVTADGIGSTAKLQLIVEPNIFNPQFRCIVNFLRVSVTAPGLSCLPNGFDTMPFEASFYMFPTADVEDGAAFHGMCVALSANNQYRQCFCSMPLQTTLCGRVHDPHVRIFDRSFRSIEFPTPMRSRRWCPCQHELVILLFEHLPRIAK